MSRKRFTPKQIIAKLREAEVGLSQGMTVGQIFRQQGIAEQNTFTSNFICQVRLQIDKFWPPQIPQGLSTDT